MKNFSRRLGLVGLVFALLGLLGYGMAAQFMGFWVIPWTLAAVCFVLYALYHPDQLRLFFTSRTARYEAGNLVTAAIVGGIVVFAALLTHNHSYRYDLTANRQFSLASQTVKILQNLDKAVKVSGFFQTGSPMKIQGRELLERYKRVSEKFSYEIVDPDREPAKANEAGITAYDQVVVRAGDESEKIGRLTEEDLTNAILHVTKPGKKKIYFIKGHGEKDLNDGEKNGFSLIKSELTDKNFEVADLSLVNLQSVPADAQVLVEAGPLKEFLPEELALLEGYLKSGGQVFFLIDPEQAPDLADMLKKFGLILGEDMVVDETDRLPQGSPLMPVAYRYVEHPALAGFKLPTAFPLVRSVEPAKTPVEGVTVSPLIYTGENSWAEMDVVSILKDGRWGSDPAVDPKGPIPVAAAGMVEPEKPAEGQTPATPEGKKPPREGRFIVIGDSEFATNQFFPVFGNGDLFMNSVSWLAEEADQIAIRPKERGNEPLMLTMMQARLLFWVPMVLLPLSVLITAILVLTARRRFR